MISQEAVQSVQKGYEFLQIIISYLPAPISAFVNLVFVIVGISELVGAIKFIFGGGD